MKLILFLIILIYNQIELIKTNRSENDNLNKLKNVKYYLAELDKQSNKNLNQKNLKLTEYDLLKSQEHRIPKSLNDIKNQKFSDEEIYEFFMYGESNQFNDIDQDKVYKHLSIKNGELPLDSIIGEKKNHSNLDLKDKKLDYDDDDEDNFIDHSDQVQMRSTKLINYFNIEEKIKFFNHKSTSLEAKQYLNELSKINFNELSATYRAVLRYINSPFKKYLDVAKFVVQTVKKIFKQLELHTVLFEIENGIYTRVSCILCMTFYSIFRSPIFFAFSTEKIVNLICLLKLNNPVICSQMADNFSKTFHFIRMNSQLTVEETCGNLIGTQCLVETSNKLNWTVTLPPILNKNYRNLIDVPQPITNPQQPPIQKEESIGSEERTFFVGHLTDVHVDQRGKKLLYYLEI